MVSWCAAVFAVHQWKQCALLNRHLTAFVLTLNTSECVTALKLHAVRRFTD